MGDEPLVWHALDTTNYNVNLYHFAFALNKPTSNVLFWAVTQVEVPREMRNIRLAIGSNAASIWWLNGEEVIRLYGHRMNRPSHCRVTNSLRGKEARCPTRPQPANARSRLLVLRYSIIAMDCVLQRELVRTS